PIATAAARTTFRMASLAPGPGRRAEGCGLATNLLCKSVQLYTRKLDHLRPLLGLFGNELAKIGGGTDERRTAQVSELGVHLWVGERGINFLIELVDDFSGRVRGRADAKKRTRLVTGHELADSRNVRQRLR